MMGCRPPCYLHQPSQIQLAELVTPNHGHDATVVTAQAHQGSTLCTPHALTMGRVVALRPLRLALFKQRRRAVQGHSSSRYRTLITSICQRTNAPVSPAGGTLRRVIAEVILAAPAHTMSCEAMAQVGFSYLKTILHRALSAVAYIIRHKHQITLAQSSCIVLTP